ncbi:MAG: hypothetical protein JST63_07805 [Bacteroidetes bacterium]|nr:hypothetical protein [Bacteroidota bacterium]
MKTKILIITLLLFTSCCKKHNVTEVVIEPDPVNKVLILQIDYTTNKLIGGRELSFEKQTSTFTLVAKKQPPSDFGFVKLYYMELNELIFYGTEVFMGKGKIIFPDSFSPPDHFETSASINTPFPSGGLEVIEGSNYETTKPWEAVKHLTLVKKYMQLNPKQKVKLLYYNPVAGLDAMKWGQWIIILKN